jgi:SAM-dependent methyltransferase
MTVPDRVPGIAALESLDAARRILHAEFRAFSDTLDRSGAKFVAAWASEFDALLGALFPTMDLLRSAFHGYVRFATDSLRLQAAFEKRGTYRASSYADTSQRVYHNADYMMSEYLPGLLLSHYLWPHHYRQLLFFDSAFVRYLKDTGVRRFAEVGIGTGLYSRRVLEAVPGSLGHGYDISPSAEAFVAHHLRSTGLAQRYDIVLQDIVAVPPEEPYASVVCVEVLEHLEDPVAFLGGLRRMLAPGGRGFVTAAVSADHADHIYLYRSASDVEAHIREAGFNVEQSFVAAAYPPRYPEQPVPLAAAFVVF